MVSPYSHDLMTGADDIPIIPNKAKVRGLERQSSSREVPSGAGMGRALCCGLWGLGFGVGGPEV